MHEEQTEQLMSAPGVLRGAAGQLKNEDKVSPFAQAFQQSGVSRQDLKNIISLLEKKLAPILSPIPPTDDAKKEQEPQGDSDMVTAVMIGTREISQSSLHLRSIIDRLTI